MDWQTKAKQRDAKLAKRRSANMVETSRSIKSVIMPTIVRKGRDAAARLRPDKGDRWSRRSDQQE